MAARRLWGGERRASRCRACGFGGCGLLLRGAAAGGIEPTADNVQSEVFNKSCAFSTCHAGASPAGEMNLEDPALPNVVGVPSSQQPALHRIEPSDPDRSYLYLKLTQDAPAVGTRMPTTAPLEPARIELVRAWIQSMAPIVAPPCAAPGAPGNSKGVGEYCTRGGGECSDNSDAFVCVVDIRPDDQPICVMSCSTDEGCGEDARCAGETDDGPKGCVPSCMLE